MSFAFLDVHHAEYTPLPEFGGSEAILHRSPDGRRLAGTFKESGRHEVTLGYDEFIYVVGGTATLNVDGGEPRTLAAGMCVYLTQGSTVIFEFSEDFHDVAVLVSDQTIEY